jgi:uncharacterized protein YcsI (UPF0317 family)
MRSMINTTINQSNAAKAQQLRAAIRSGQFQGHTSGIAGDLVQANLCVLPKSWADEFLLFCQRNPKPCPLLAVTDVGSWQVPTLGASIDLRTDLPRYRVWKFGELMSEPTDLSDLWQDDFVAFIVGCSFSFESALAEQNIHLRHVEQKKNVAMYRSNIATHSTTRFGGPMVVSMRPLKPADAIRAIQITARYPNVHGAPIHLGDPSAIGIKDLSNPDYGDAVEVKDGEIPVFWACGVTPQSVVKSSKPPLCITHAPGAMLITDLANPQLSSV